MLTTKCKIEFSKVLQSLCTAKSKKKKFDTFTYTSLGFNSSFKNRFQEAFWLELSILKNTLHALNPLIPGGNKQSHILKHAYSFQLQVCLSMYNFSLPPSIKGLISYYRKLIISSKYLLISSDELLFLTKLLQLSPVFLNVGTTECFVSKAAISRD